MHTNHAKQRVRERIWTLLEREPAVASGVYGRIPAFAGAAQAAERLAQLPAWRTATVIIAVPDQAQLPVRSRALDSGKLRPIDLVIYGSVAVNRHGVRLGEGAGYSDIEVAVLTETGLLTNRSPIVTTVHDLQVVDEDLPEWVTTSSSHRHRCSLPPSQRPSGLRLGPALRDPTGQYAVSSEPRQIEIG